MSQPVTIVLLGEPVPFARTRHNKSGALFTPTKQRNAGAALRIAAQQEMLHGKCVIFDQPLEMWLTAEFGVPPSWSEKKRLAAIMHRIHPAKRPDIDNLYKLAADALNGVVYRDDALIVRATLSKCYGTQPKIVITVKPLWDAIASGKAA